MMLVNLVSRAFPMIAILLGLWLVWVWQPLDIEDGIILFILGFLAGGANDQLNPRKPVEEGPSIPWDEMGAGERFGYFIPAAGIVVVGSILMMMAIQSSRVSIKWESISSSLLMIAAGVFVGAWQWSRRHG